MSSVVSVSGDTLILTKTGYLPIKTLNNSSVEFWNGVKWSKALVVKTGTGQTLYHVKMSDGSSVKCTGNHKFSIKENDSFVERRADNLWFGDITKEVDRYPVITSELYENNPKHYFEKLRDNVVPFDFKIFSRLLWLSKKIDKECGYLQITSDDFDWVHEIKLMTNTLGTSPFIVQTIRGYHLRFGSNDVDFLMNELLMPLNMDPSDYHPVHRPCTSVVSITKLENNHDTYGFHEWNGMGIFDGVYSGYCVNY